ncbi:Eco47II family restriction endonuclease [Brucellaceae bacterium C25G]
MAKLSFISDQDLDSAIQILCAKAQAGLKRAQDEFDRNVIDPFSLMFEMDQFNIRTIEEWISFEKRRQAQKNLVQAVGDFHQNILGAVEGWQNAGPGGGVDIVSTKHQIVAEIKNKHNTIKGSDKVGLYNSLAEEVLPKNAKYHGYLAYYVEIISKGAKRFDVEFTPSDRRTALQMAPNPKIKMIDGVSFYALVTGRETALEELFKVLCQQLSAKYKLSRMEENGIYDFFYKAF